MIAEHIHVHCMCVYIPLQLHLVWPSSFRQVCAQMKGNLMHLQKQFVRQLHETAAKTSEENARTRDDTVSAITFSRREWVQGKENLQRELEKRIAALEEVSLCPICL